MLQATQRSNNTSIPKLNPISPVDKDNNVCPEDISESSPLIKQEPIHDSNPLVDSFHSMSEALQTVSNVFISKISTRLASVLLANFNWLFMTVVLDELQLL